MTSTKFSLPARRLVPLAVLTALSGLVALPVSAATVRASTDLGSAIPQPSGGGVLDRALTGDVTLGGKNFDMLLEMRRNEAADAGKSGSLPAARRAVRAPAVLADAAQPAPMAAVHEGVQSALPALIKSGVADVDEALGLPKGTTLQSARDWLGRGGTGDAPAVPVVDVRIPAGVDQPGPGAAPAGLSPLLASITEIIQVVRDYSYWLLGAAALALALSAAFKKFNRRI